MKPRMIQGILLGVMIGVAVGIGVYTFAYARGWAYLTDNPAACANCHVMREQFDGWLKSSHRAVATCNHCHTPANFIGKYATKASNGFWHSFSSPQAVTKTIFTSNRTAGRSPSKLAGRVMRKLSALLKRAPGIERRAARLPALPQLGRAPAVMRRITDVTV